MNAEFKDGRLFLHRTEAERDPLLKRLGRIEGQVRGLQQMIQQDRYCGDELQQASAILAAMRAVMRLLLAQHVSVGIERAVDGAIDRGDAMRDIEQVLAAILRGP